MKYVDLHRGWQAVCTVPLRSLRTDDRARADGDRASTTAMLSAARSGVAGAAETKAENAKEVIVMSFVKESMVGISKKDGAVRRGRLCGVGITG